MPWDAKGEVVDPPQDLWRESVSRATSNGSADAWTDAGPGSGGGSSFVRPRAGSGSSFTAKTEAAGESVAKGDPPQWLASVLESEAENAGGVEGSDAAAAVPQGGQGQGLQGTQAVEEGAVGLPQEDAPAVVEGSPGDVAADGAA